MSNMGDTLTVKLTDAGRKTGGLIARFKKSSISGATLLTMLGLVFQFGGKATNFIVTNSSVYQNQKQIFTVDIEQLQFQNRILEAEIKHGRHIIESQNFMLRKMFQAELINIDEYTSMIHAVSHTGDSL